MRGRKAEQKKLAKAMLRELLTQGQMIWTLGEASRSNLSERVRLFITTDDNILDITVIAAQALGYSCNLKGMYVQGCGLNRRFYAVHNLSRLMYEDGYALTAVEL
tara:strand:- start:1830 stop:2144 length:315 start_codon:yes stop_codon:yes gene_type:complete